MLKTARTWLFPILYPVWSDANA